MGEIRQSRFYKASITMGQNYNAFPRKKEVKRETYNNFLKDYYKEIRSLMIYEKYRYKFHSFVGTLYIVKYAPPFKKNPLNPNGTVNLYGRVKDRLKILSHFKKTGKVVVIYRDLGNFENYRFRVHWTKEYTRIGGVLYFNVKPCRIFTQLMLENVAKNNADYDLYNKKLERI